MSWQLEERKFDFGKKRREWEWHSRSMYFWNVPSERQYKFKTVIMYWVREELYEERMDIYIRGSDDKEV